MLHISFQFLPHSFQRGLANQGSSSILRLDSARSFSRNSAQRNLGSYCSASSETETSKVSMDPGLENYQNLFQPEGLAK
jgi:hypothetical protein